MFQATIPKPLRPPPISMSNFTPLLTACPPCPIAQAGDQYAADIIRGLSEELATSESAADFLETTYLTEDTADFLRMAMDRIDLTEDTADFLRMAMDRIDLGHDSTSPLGRTVRVTTDVEAYERADGRLQWWQGPPDNDNLSNHEEAERDRQLAR